MVWFKWPMVNQLDFSNLLHFICNPTNIFWSLDEWMLRFVCIVICNCDIFITADFDKLYFVYLFAFKKLSYYLLFYKMYNNIDMI